MTIYPSIVISDNSSDLCSHYNIILEARVRTRLYHSAQFDFELGRPNEFYSLTSIDLVIY
jgi:hypothetical protein